ncbi:MAG: glutamine--fructose-6-phosphate aminotransferase, partial [Candidatus Nanohaloarchaea archaeon]
MCGIIGYTGDRDAGELLLEGLHNLEYRGYDSSGLVVIDREDGLQVRKTADEVDRLAEKHDIIELDGTAGIGHTRWATHGGVTTDNAHPHTCATARIAIVHNGIIENHE